MPASEVGEVGVEPAGHLLAREHLGDALGQAMALGDHDDPPAVLHPPAQVRHRLGGAAAVARGLARGRSSSDRRSHRRPARRRRRRGRGPTRAARARGRAPGGRPGPRTTRCRGCPAGRSARRCRRRRWPSRRRGTPGSWRRGRGRGCGRARGRTARRRCRRAGCRARSPCRRRGPGRGTPCPRRRCPRRACRAGRRAPGSWSISAPRALADRVGQQDLAAGRGPQPVLGDLEAALVGDLEPADLLDRVAPELDADRVVLGGREDVEDAAAHGELAAPLDQVGAGVGRGREVLDDLLERARRPRP